MTHLETARYNEVIGLQIGAIQQIAHKLNENLDMEVLETIVAELEETVAALKGNLAGVPHKRL